MCLENRNLAGIPSLQIGEGPSSYKGEIFQIHPVLQIVPFPFSVPSGYIVRLHPPANANLKNRFFVEDVLYQSLKKRDTWAVFASWNWDVFKENTSEIKHGLHSGWKFRITMTFFVKVSGNMKFSDVSEGVFNLKCWDCEIFNCTFSSMLESQSFLHILGKQLYLKDFSAENQSSCFFHGLGACLGSRQIWFFDVCCHLKM